MELDADGDLVLERRPCTGQADGEVGEASEEGSGACLGDVVLSEVHLECLAAGQDRVVTAFHRRGSAQTLLEVEHSMATMLDLVGLQVWRGALLLGDYILHQAPRFSGCTLLELGSGPGLAGLLAAQHARLVFLTDVGLRVLENCEANVEHNLHRLPCTSPRPAQVRQLDWTDPPGWLMDTSATTANLYCPTGAPIRGVMPASTTAAAAATATVSPSVGPSSNNGNNSRQPAAASSVAQQGGGCSLLGSGGPFAWQPSDLQELQHLSCLLAADVVYDNDLTEAFMRTAAQLLRYVRSAAGAAAAAAAAAGGETRHDQQQAQQAQQAQQQAPPQGQQQRGSVLLVALERRVNFTLHDLEPRAPAYDYWRTLFAEDRTAKAAGLGGRGSAGGSGAARVAAGSQQACAAAKRGASSAGQEAGGEPGTGGGQHVMMPQPAAAAPFPLIGQRLDTSSIPQALEYERSEYLELWELWLDEGPEQCCCDI